MKKVKLAEVMNGSKPSEPPVKAEGNISQQRTNLHSSHIANRDANQTDPRFKSLYCSQNCFIFSLGVVHVYADDGLVWMTET